MGASARLAPRVESCCTRFTTPTMGLSTAIAGTADSVRILSGGEEGAVRVWRVSKESRQMEASMKVGLPGLGFKGGSSGVPSRGLRGKESGQKEASMTLGCWLVLVKVGGSWRKPAAAWARSVKGCFGDGGGEGEGWSSKTGWRMQVGCCLRLVKGGCSQPLQ